MIALDTNILVYVESPWDRRGRHERAVEIMDMLAPIGAIIPLQVLGEFLNVCRNKKWLALEAAETKVQLCLVVFSAISTGADDLLKAARLSAQHDLQFFDAVIVTVSRRAGAGILLSEDMQDGQVIDGLTIINPFNPANARRLSDYLASLQ